MNDSMEEPILRFAAGELTAEEEATFLARCEATPAHWRQAVLAVAEQRCIVAALQDLATPAMPAPEPRAAVRWRRAAACTAGALAAGLLLGIWVALAVFRPDHSTLQAVRTPAVQAPANPNRTPLVDTAADADAMAPALTVTQQAVLRRHGIQVQDDPTLYLVAMDNGTRWMIPTRRTTVHYVKP